LEIMAFTLLFEREKEKEEEEEGGREYLQYT
jgi:hypothetical protein